MLPVFVAIFLLAGCTATGSSPGGMAAYVDPVTGRQVVVETAPPPGEAGAMVDGGAAPAATVSAGQGAGGQGAALRPRLTTLDDEQYIDVEDMDRVLEQRESERFYVLPDGTGMTRTVMASEVGSDGVDAPPAADTVAGEAGAVWRRCDSPAAIALVTKRVDRRQVLQFPAVPARQVEPVGYRMAVPPGAVSIQLWSILKSAHAVSPVPAVLDAKGRVVAVAYSASTQTLPETAFRYGRVGFILPVPVLPEGGALAILDAALLAGVLPPRCLPIPDDAPYAPTSTGTVTVDFQ